MIYHEYYQEGRGKVGSVQVGYVAECVHCGLKMSKRVGGRGYAETVYQIGDGEWVHTEVNCRGYK